MRIEKNLQGNNYLPRSISFKLEQENIGSDNSVLKMSSRINWIPVNRLYN